MKFFSVPADKKNMADVNNETRTFQEILEEKLAIPPMGNNSSTNSVINSDLYLVFPYENEFFINAEPVHLPSVNLKSSSYFNKTVKIPAPKSAERPVKIESVFAIERLSTSAQLALITLGAQTELGGRQITVSAIKRAYRKKARQHHPDLNPGQNGLKFNEYKELSRMILQEIREIEKTDELKKSA